MSMLSTTMIREDRESFRDPADEHFPRGFNRGDLFCDDETETVETAIISTAVKSSFPSLFSSSERAIHLSRARVLADSICEVRVNVTRDEEEEAAPFHFKLPIFDGPSDVE